ncbi:thiamine diphosphate-binding protein, partial [Ochromonadaceae sp. CCMP2298]
MEGQCSVGSYLSRRLVEAGVSHFFTVPGDFTLALLDELLANPGLKMVGCCNELNAGYAADGYCRGTKGMGCCVVTYMVGTLSIMNAVAGAYSEDLPLLIVAGAPNTLDAQHCHIMHHTLGKTDFYQSGKCFEPITAGVFSIRHLSQAAGQIDEALRLCATRRKPVYLEIACNLSVAQVSLPTPLSAQYYTSDAAADADAASVEAAVTHVMRRITSVEKVVLIGGSKLLTADAVDAFTNLALKLGCGYASLPDAKGLLDETAPGYMGCYWAGISSRHCQGIVESADLRIFAGSVLSDISTVGWTALLTPEKTVYLDLSSVHIPGGGGVKGGRYPLAPLRQVLSMLALRTEGVTKPVSLQYFHRYAVPAVPRVRAVSFADITAAKDQELAAPLSLRFLLSQLQESLAGVASVVVETGDSWFIGQKLHLPRGTRFHIQMQYGSCGWALPASLGLAIAQSGTH